jgi:glycosyltransferase involved in cell wall biosynthesis
LKLAYFTNRYGAASFTFIMTEVEHLRRLGHAVHTFSVRHPGGGEAVSEQVRREQAATEYFLPPGGVARGALAVLASAARAVALRPARFASAAALAWRTSSPGLRARARQAAYLALACRLAERMRAKGVEHLHNHLGSASATIAMLASEVGGIPFSLTIHGGWIFYEPRQWALGEKLSRAAFTACVSAFCRSQCMLFVPHDEWDKLQVVRCAVDERFLAGEPTPVPDTPTLVCVARLAEEKAHLLLLEAAAAIAASGTRLRLVLVGDGPLRAVLERRIAELRLGSVVEITGLVSPADVQRHVSAARAFVLASLTEGLPVSIMEALALGRPVVATNVGAIAELVRPGETGWLVTAGSAEALAGAMLEALRTPVAALTEMGRRGRSLVAERHRAAVEIPRLERLLAGAPTRRPPSSPGPPA